MDLKHWRVHLSVIVNNTMKTCKLIKYFPCNEYSEKGLRALFQATVRAKIAMPDSQWYPWNPNLNKNVEENVFFWSQKVFNLHNFLWARNAHITFADQPQMKINSFQKQKRALFYKILNGTVVYRALPSLHGGLLEVTQTVP